MTRGQYIAMCLIGGVAIVAFLESYRLGIAFTRIGLNRPALKRNSGNI